MTLPLALLTKRHYQKKMYKNEIGYKKTNLYEKKIRAYLFRDLFALEIGITFLISYGKLLNIKIFLYRMQINLSTVQ